MNNRRIYYFTIDFHPLKMKAQCQFILPYVILMAVMIMWWSVATNWRHSNRNLMMRSRNRTNLLPTNSDPSTSSSTPQQLTPSKYANDDNDEDGVLSKVEQPLQEIKLQVDIYRNYNGDDVQEPLSDDKQTYYHRVPSTMNDEYPSVVADTQEEDSSAATIDSWSIVWYVASFGGLIAFFLVVTCSEWCCKRPMLSASSQMDTNGDAGPLPRNPHQHQHCNHYHHQQQQQQQTMNQHQPETPPPSYDHFAPPTYESISLKCDDEKLQEYSIYVVPVPVPEHDTPPSYLTAANTIINSNRIISGTTPRTTVVTL